MNQCSLPPACLSGVLEVGDEDDGGDDARPVMTQQATSLSI